MFNFRGFRCVGSQNWRNPLGFCEKNPQKCQWDFQGPPRTWDPFPSGTHTIPILQGILMGVVWEWGYHYWGSLEFPLKMGSFKVVRNKEVSSCRASFCCFGSTEMPGILLTLSVDVELRGLETGITNHRIHGTNGIFTYVHLVDLYGKCNLNLPVRCIRH